MFGRGPPFLIFDFLLQVQEFEYHLQYVPPLLDLNQENFSVPLSQKVVSYMLMGGTFADGAHFRSAFLCGQENDVSEHGWHSYDAHNSLAAVPSPALISCKAHMMRSEKIASSSSLSILETISELCTAAQKLLKNYPVDMCSLGKCHCMHHPKKLVRE